MSASTTLISALAPSLSVERIARYRPSEPDTDPDLATLVNYMWNMALADSLHCCLGAVEVALRNTIYITLSDHFGTSTWYDQTGILDDEQAKEITSAKEKIAYHKLPITPGRVVGEMTFGFWVTILSRNYEARLWRSNRSETIKQAFPRVPKRLRKRGAIQDQYNRMRALRNRVYHHEPLFDDPRLAQRHQEVLQGISWISPDLRQLVDRFDRFPAVHSQAGKQAVEDRVRTHLEARGTQQPIPDSEPTRE